MMSRCMIIQMYSIISLELKANVVSNAKKCILYVILGILCPGPSEEWAGGRSVLDWHMYIYVCIEFVSDPEVTVRDGSGQPQHPARS